MSSPVEVEFDEAGLVPCIAQDADTGEVLTLAYMNAESLGLTESTGEIHYFSRSRQEIWKKGETSGNVQRVRQLRVDCDGDALLALVEPAGPACHTGERTCFYRGLESGGVFEPVNGEALAELERTLAARAASAPRAATRWSCSRTRTWRPRRCWRRPRRSPAPSARRATSA